MRREGISTPTHPSYSTGSTHKNRRKVAKNFSNTAQGWKQTQKERRKKRDSAGYRILGLRSLSDTNIRVDVVRDRGNVLARMSHPMPTYLVWNENQSCRSSAHARQTKHTQTRANMEPERQSLDLHRLPNQTNPHWKPDAT